MKRPGQNPPNKQFLPHPGELAPNSSMQSLAKRIRNFRRCLPLGAAGSLCSPRHYAVPSRRRPKSPPLALKKSDEKSEWWIVDGEMHEIGDNVPPRERFVIPRDNIPNRRRKQLREQFMRRTRLVLKEAVRTKTQFAVRRVFVKC